MMYYDLDRRVLLRYEFQVSHSTTLTADHNPTIDRQFFVSLTKILKLAKIFSIIFQIKSFQNLHTKLKYVLFILQKLILNLVISANFRP